jgi:threonyl-tRNA synthetase
MTDVLGRSWQMGTIQLDSQMPQRFGLTYVGADNAEHVPYVVHRALLGSLERFIGILIEHTGGDLPFWLAPVQVRVLPVSDQHREGAATIVDGLRDAGFRVELDDRDESVGKRIRDAEMQRTPRTIVYGEKESAAALAVRTRGGEQKTQSLAELVLELTRLSR